MPTIVGNSALNCSATGADHFNVCEQDKLQALDFYTSHIRDILVFMSSLNFILSWVEHEKGFITSGPDIFFQVFVFISNHLQIILRLLPYTIYFVCTLNI